MVLKEKDMIEVDNLPENIKNFNNNDSEKNHVFLENIIGLTMKEIEKKVIKSTLELNKNHRLNTANMLGMSEKGLRNKIKEYNL